MVCNNTEGSLGSSILPRRFVISLAGSCCNCNRDSSGSGSTDLANEDCGYFNGYFEVIQTSDSDRYVHEFPEDAPFNARTIELRLNSDPNQPEDCMHACVFITFGEDEEGNPVGSVGWGAVVKSIDKLRTLRRRSTNTLCCWPQKIQVNPSPVPDYVTPQPEWMPGNPDDLNHAPFWPSLDFDLMEDSDYTPVRYANGELQLRIKDLSSEAFGIPWGHTRIYSNRLSNSHDYGNGFNWMVHEWPRLVQFKSPIEPKPVGVTTEEPRNGCTIALVRGTRNALWFDEVVDKSEEGTWQPRFNARHVLEHDKEEHLIRIFAPNGHVWEFYDFTCPTSREFEKKTKEQRDAIAPGCLKRHIGPYGEETQEIVFTYKKCQLEKMERSALASDQSIRAFNLITETFQYCWKEGRVESVTLSRKLHGKENNVSRVKYSYYGEKETHGNEGDLKTVQVEFWDQGWKSRKDTLQYYAYETSSNSTYAQGMLKAVVGPDAYHRMKLAGKDPLTSGPDKNFSDLWIEYFSDGDVSSTSGSRRQKQLVRRIKSITLDRGGRAFAYKYEFSSSKSEASSNVWISKVSETRPDNSEVSVYSDGSLCTLAHALESQEGRWIYRFDWKSYGQLYWLRTPAAVSSFSAQANGMLNSSYSAGKTYSLLYYDNPNFVGEVYMGKTNVTTSNPQQDVENRIRMHKFEYLPYQYQDKTVWYLRADINPQTNVAYQIEWLPKCYAGQGQLTLTLPPVPASQHGNNQQTTSTVKFNRFGLPVWSLDERGVKTSTTYYDQLSVPQRIVTNTVEGEVLTTDLRADHFGRITRTYGPIHRAVTNPGGTQTERIRRANWTIFDDVEGVIISADGFQRAGGGVQIMNPVSASQIDRAGRSIQQVRAVVRNTNAPDRIRAIDLSSPRSWCRRIVIDYNDRNQLKTERVYYDITNGRYFETQYETYDAMYRPQIVVAPDGTKARTDFDVRGLPTQQAIGIQTLTPVASFYYDYEPVLPNQGSSSSNNGNTAGNGVLTTAVQYVEGGNRVTQMDYDWRDLITKRKIVHNDAEEIIGWDVAGREDRREISAPLSDEEENSPSELALEFATIPRYDSRGLAYRKEYLQRNRFRGADGTFDRIMSDWVWRDQSGNPIKVRPAGSLAYQIIDYDSLGRQTNSYHAFGTPYSSNYQQAIQKGAVVNAVSTTYDPLGQPIVVTEVGRAIDNKHVVGVQPFSVPTRVTSSGAFYDPLGRVVATVDYGTGAPSSNTTIPACTDTTLVSRSYYNERGELERVVNSKAQEMSFGYDDAGRKVSQNENNVRVIKSNLLPDGRLESMDEIDLLFSRTRRIKSCVYGWNNSSLHWNIQTNLLPARIVDSDGATTQFAYNQQGEVTASLDARGCKHVFKYDEYGRQTDDIVETLGHNVYEYPRRIQRKFDNLGRLKQVATYASVGDNPDSGITSVTRRYSFAGQVYSESTIASFLSFKEVNVTYLGDQHVNASFDLILQANDANSIRPVSLHYPSGRTLRLTYGSPYERGDDNDSSDYWFGRVSGIHDSASVGQDEILPNAYASYRYWGVANLIEVNLNAHNVDNFTTKYRSGLIFNLSGGNRSQPFAALDNQGRLKTLRWDYIDSAKGPLPTTRLIDLEYDYDRTSLRTSQRLKALTSQDRSQETYRYDDLNRLGDYRRVNQGKSSPPLVTPSQQSWTLDGSGNWLNWDVRSNSNLHQKRQHGPGDRIASIKNLANEGKWTQPVYDQAGNLTVQPQPDLPSQPMEVRYDAWNRPAYIKSGNNQVLLEYDGFGRILAKHSNIPGTSDSRFTRYTYSPDWQLLEEDVLDYNASAALDSLRYEYIWGVRGPNDLVCREKYDSDDTLLERQYALSDINGNVVGVVPDAQATLDQLITYDPYGTPSGEDDFQHLFGGYYYDSTTGLYLVRNRVYHPKLGRWLTKDPLGMVDGPNLYEYCAGDPVNLVDPSGGYAESFWDAFSFGVGVTSLAYNWQHGSTTDVVVDLLGLSADALAIALPFIPGGAGAAIRAYRVGNLALDAANASHRIARTANLASDIVRTGEIGANAYQSYDAYQRGDYLGATLGGLHVGVRGIQSSYILPRRFPGRTPTRLTHLTTEAADRKIHGTGSTAGKLGSKWGIFALTRAKVSNSLFLRSLYTLVPDKLTHATELPEAAISSFRRPIAWGPFSAFRRWIAGVHSTPLGSIDLRTGKFIPGEILVDGVFRQANRKEWRNYYLHQFALDYGFDAGIYGITGLGAYLYLGNQPFIDTYNSLFGNE